jgi:hypothetical protein
MRQPATALTIGSLVSALNRLGIEATFDDLRAILWLARELPAPASRNMPNGPPIAGPVKPKDERASPEPGPSTPASQQMDQARTIDSVPALNDAVQLFGRKSGTGEAARPVRLRGAPAIAQSLAVGRALRPLLRRRAGCEQVVDDQASAEHFAETGLRAIVYRPVRERWFDVVLISEQMASMTAWQPVRAQFERVLHEVGGFRNVRTLSLHADAACPEVFGVGGMPVRKDVLQSRTGRTLILVMSDCTSAAWYDGRVGAWLAGLAAQMPLALVQFLPSSMWPNTAVGFAELRVRSPGLASATARLQVNRPPWAEGEPGVIVPVFELAPRMVQSWARMTAGAGHAWSSAALLPLPGGRAVARTHRRDRNALSVDERVRQFRAIADRDAQLIAAYSAVVRPLTPPVLRVIHRAMVPDSSSVALAQVLLGGLLYPLATPEEARYHPDGVEYEFVDGLREALARTLTAQDIVKVNLALYGYLVQLSGASFDFTALLADTNGTERLPDAALPFVQFARHQLGRAGFGTRNHGHASAALRVLKIRKQANVFFFSCSDGESRGEWEQAAPDITEELVDTALSKAQYGDDAALEKIARSILPDSLIDHLKSWSTGQVVELVLDQHSAHFAWEQLLSNRLSDNDGTLGGARLGLTRRLEALPKSGVPVAVEGPALVVGIAGERGSPTSGFPRLRPALADLLQSLTGTQAHSVFDDAAADEIARHIWRIVHLQAAPLSKQPKPPMKKGAQRK